MTQPRMPAIGDAVRRYDDKGKIVFDGFVLGVAEDASWFVTVAPSGAPPAGLVEDDPWPPALTETVAALYLVRGLHGWRWAPFDGRPEIGIVTYDDKYKGAVLRVVLMRRAVVGKDVVRGNGWMVLRVAGRSICPWDHHPDVPPWFKQIELQSDRDIPGFLPDEAVACAIAGIDGWGWEPSWSGLAPKRESP